MENLNLNDFINPSLMCICDSGKKYINCCKRKSLDMVGLINLLTKTVPLNDPLKKNKCIFNKHFGTCEKIRSNSHSISQSSNLDPISKENKLYSFHDSSFTTRKNNGNITKFKKISSVKASVFYGVCGEHDKIYKRIDDFFDKKSYDNYFWASQREILRTLYVIDKNINLFNNSLRYLNSINGIFYYKHHYKLVDISNYKSQISESLKNLKKEKNKYKKIINLYFNSLTSDFSINKNILYSVNLEFDYQIPYNFSCFMPIYTFKILNFDSFNINYNKEMIYISLLSNVNNPNNNGSTLVLSCLKKHKNSIKIINKISEIKPNFIAEHLMLFSLMHDNSFYNIDYIDKLSSFDKENLEKIHNDFFNFSVSKKIDANYIPDLKINTHFKRFILDI